MSGATVQEEPGDCPEAEGFGVDSGDAFLYFGRTTGWPDAVNDSNADVRFEHDTWNVGWAGYGAAAYPGGTDRPEMRGDLDGDGLDEVFLATWNAHDSYNGVLGPGALYVFAGRTCWPSNQTAAQAKAFFVGGVQWESLGYNGRAAIADINGDAMDDILLSTYRRPVEAQGGVYIFFGHPRGP